MEIKQLKGEPPYELLLDADPSKELVDKYLASGECFIAEELGNVLGAYIIMPRKDGIYEIMNVAVHPNNQRQGIGRELVAHACKIAANKGGNKIEVGTAGAGVGQLAFYQKCGFRITGIKADFFTNNYPEPIIENGILCTDMVMLSKKLI